MNAYELLKKHEGFRQTLYRCTAGHRTIGYGYNLDANPLRLEPSELAHYCKSGITETEAGVLLQEMIDKTTHDLSVQLGCFTSLSDNRKAALIDMAYNLGVDGFMQFHTTIRHLTRQEWTQAAAAMKASRWAAQVGDRAVELAGIVAKG